jgi:thiol-disulfide isomerase/thioredoxin
VNRNHTSLSERALAGATICRSFARVKKWFIPLTLLTLTCLSLPTHAAGWTLKDQTGAQLHLADFKGKWVLVNFWAPWCGPCLEELPALVSLQRQHKDLEVIGVAVMYHKKREALDAARQYALPYHIVLGTEDTAADFGGVDALPTSLLYAPTGELAARQEGPTTQQEVEQFMLHWGQQK